MRTRIRNGRPTAERVLTHHEFRQLVEDREVDRNVEPAESQDQTADCAEQVGENVPGVVESHAKQYGRTEKPDPEPDRHSRCPCDSPDDLEALGATAARGPGRRSDRRASSAPAARLGPARRGSAQLRGLPGLGELACDQGGQAFDRDPVLGEGVAVAQGDRVVVLGVEVDGDAPGGADLVLAAVALADRPAGVVLGLDPGGAQGRR